jgi:hypothetical protein
MSIESTVQATASPQTRRTWIFQANPNRYHIHQSLQAQREELWNLNQHVNDVHPGDRVLIWVSGDDAGIYALGTIMSPPIIRSDSAVGQQYWIQPGEGRQPRARVRVRYERVFLDRPLLKVYLTCDPSLGLLSIVRSPRGTNFPVSDDEWAALAVWLDELKPPSRDSCLC